MKKYGLEIAIPSPNDHVRTSYVVISSGKNRFVDDVHIPNAVLRSEGRESCEEQADTSIQETRAIHVSSYTSYKETCANTLGIPPTQESFYTKRTIPTNERKWKVVHACSPDGGDLAMAVSKMVTSMVRHDDQDERQSDGSMHRDTLTAVPLKASEKHGARDFPEKYCLFVKGNSKARIEYCEDSTTCLAYFRAIQGHSGGISIDPELMGIGKSVFITKVVLSSFNLSWRMD